MNLCDIKKQIAELQAELEGIVDPSSSALLVKLLAILESCHSIASTQVQMIQQLKNEINRLKGEQGKPTIKPDKAKSYSTEKERKEAEFIPEPSKIGFRLTKEKLAALQENQIPKEILDRLAGIINRPFSSENEFMEKVASVIGKQKAKAYKNLLLKHCRYKKRNRKPKVVDIEIDRIKKCEIDLSTLPDDVISYGYEENVVQDIAIKRDNIKFLKHVYYSPSQKKTFMANIPVGYEGGYGPGIKAEIVTMKYINNMSEPKIHETLQSLNVKISATYISNRLTFQTHMAPFLEEKNHLVRTALEVSSYQQIDDTGCRVNGSNQYTHILCNPFYTAFFTKPRKDRMTILDILRCFEPRLFMFNDDTFRFLEMFNVSSKTIDKIKPWPCNVEQDETQIQALLSDLFPDPDKGKNTRARIMEAAAIAHYHQGNEGHIVTILVADDAPQFKLLTFFLALCWIHIGRHFKKLNPVVPQFQNELEIFQKKFWAFYAMLRKYQEDPVEAKAKMLEQEFDKLFSEKTAYPELNERIVKTQNKKKELLVVLQHPEVPLHNNRSENGARVQKRRQDISLQTKSSDGTIAKDAMMSIVETCKKLGINARDLIKDRILQLGKISKLGDVIKVRASQ